MNRGKKSKKSDYINYQMKLIKFFFRQAEIKEIEFGDGLQEWDTFLELARASFYSRLRNTTRSEIKLNDFELVNVIGKGAYGDVILAMKKDTEDFFAIKIMSKIKLIKQQHIPHAKQEKDIASSVRFKFSVFMPYFFQTSSNIFFVLELVLGKTLYEIISKGPMNETVAKFFASQILLGLEYLHYLGIVYRDLKLENIIMDQNGYIKIADFGFAKILDGRTFTFCGTPEYMSPEILEGRGYGMSADWWSYGIIVYELCAGFTPFHSDIVAVIFAKIKKGKYKTPNFFSENLKDLLTHLLSIDISKRYGCMRLGVDRIKSHKWLESISWDDILNKTIKAPITCNAQLTTSDSPIEFKENQTLIPDKYVKIFNEF